MAVWTAAQTVEFRHTIREHRLYAAFRLIALRGLQAGGNRVFGLVRGGAPGRI